MSRFLLILLYPAFLLISCNNSNITTDNLHQNDDETEVVEDNTQGNDNSDGKLYLRTFQLGGTLNIKWIYLGNDGNVVYDPTEGVDPINYTAERNNNADKVGKYKIEHNQLHIDWDNGNTSNLPLEYKDGDINFIDGGIATRNTGVPADFRLNGRYAGGAISKNFAVTHAYIFKNDGSFILKRMGSVSTKTENSNNGTSTSEDELPGHYTISGNTLTLHLDDGMTQKAVIGIWNLKGGMQYLVINQSSFRIE